MEETPFSELKLFLWPTVFLALGVGLLFAAGATLHGGLSLGNVAASLFFGGLALGVLILAYSSFGDAIKDLKTGPLEVTGRITGKSIHMVLINKMPSTTFTIQVNGTGFQVSRSIHDWVNEGDEVLITYWHNTRDVVNVDKIF